MKKADQQIALLSIQVIIWFKSECRFAKIFFIQELLVSHARISSIRTGKEEENLLMTLSNEKYYQIGKIVIFNIYATHKIQH